MAETIAEATRQLLVEDQWPVISNYELTAFLLRLYNGDYTDRVEVRTRKTEPSENDLYRSLQRLKEARVVREDPDFGSSVYQVFDVLEQSAEAVCCVVDPLCYVSHLAAMQMQGLTERSPRELVFSRPTDSLWREMMQARGEHSARPRPRRNFPEKVRGRLILLHDSRHPGTWEAAGTKTRVATIGQTFLDTVTRPAWCGGMSHVLEVWEREAPIHLEEIIATVGASLTKLPKVRAGYILEEALGITDERVIAWRAFAQRGSSQKLDPEQPYAPRFSENWMLSLNA